MKKLSIITTAIILTAFFIDAKGQAIDYNTIILPSNIKNISVEEKLVQLAWENNPNNKIEYNNLIIAQKSISITHADWLDIFRITGNINEYNIDPSAIEGRNYFYPRYNFGATINLGMLISTPAKTSIAKLEYQNQEELINAKKLEIRADVLRKYEVFKLRKELLKIQANFTEDAHSAFLIAEQQFKNGEISIDDYNASFKNYNQQLEEKLTKETDYNLAKIDLESLVGVAIDEIITK